MASSPDLKVWPQVVLAGIKSGHGGAVRAYFLARYLDDGRGWVRKTELRGLAGELGVKPRTWQRWLSEAMKLGLLSLCLPQTKDKGRYYIKSLGRAAVMFDCEGVGYPAFIPSRKFVRKGWRRYAWSGYLVTLDKKPVSQRTKKAITGITARTQSRYQRGLGRRIQNYCIRGAGTTADAAELRDLLGLAIFERDGRLVQYLPDIRLVSSNTALKANKGRSEKASVYSLHASNYLLLRGKGMKLFYQSHKSAANAVRRMSREGASPYVEVFERISRGRVRGASGAKLTQYQWGLTV